MVLIFNGIITHSHTQTHTSQSLELMNTLLTPFLEEQEVPFKLTNGEKSITLGQHTASHIYLFWVQDYSSTFALNWSGPY